MISKKWENAGHIRYTLLQTGHRATHCKDPAGSHVLPAQTSQSYFSGCSTNCIPQNILFNPAQLEKCSNCTIKKQKHNIMPFRIT